MIPETAKVDEEGRNWTTVVALPHPESRFFHGGGTFTMRLRGLEPEARYRVRLKRQVSEREMTGSELAEGLAVEIEEAPGAELVRYARIR